MAETDILNPPNWHAAGLPFNPNPSYGFSVASGDNLAIERGRSGPWNSRDVDSAGHTFTLGWAGIPYPIVQRIEQFYHSFRHGWFTFIDVDGGNRYYSGRFTSPPKSTHGENGKWSVQATFEEVRSARMLQYPSDLVNLGHPYNAVDDYLNPRFALMQGNWATVLSPDAPQAILNAGAPSPMWMAAIDTGAVIGDSLALDYVGYGFAWTLPVNAAACSVNLFLDSVLIVSALDLTTGLPGAALLNGATLTPSTAATTSQPAPAAGQVTAVTITCLPVPLDMHRLSLVVSGPPAAGISGGVGSGGGSSVVGNLIAPALTTLY